MLASADTVKVVTIGDEQAIVLSSEVLRRLGIKSGDTLSIEVTPTGFSVLTDRAAKVMAVVDRVMREDKDVLCRLAE